MYNIPAVPVQRGDALIAPFSVPVDSGRKLVIDSISTTNPNKLAEYGRVGLEQIRGIDIELGERQCNATEFKMIRQGHKAYQEISRQIAMDKAETAFRKTGKPVLVEDTSLWLAANPNVTGPLIKAWCAEDEHGNFPGLVDLCTMATLKNNRMAYAIAVLAVCDGTNFKAWHGVVEGQISDYPRGENGFGWDKIFIPEVSKQLMINGTSRALTWAEMSTEEKLNNFPFRKRVVAMLKKEAQHEEEPIDLDDESL